MIGRWLTRRREAALAAYTAACAAEYDAFSHTAILTASRRLTYADLALDAWTWTERTWASRPCRCAILGHDVVHTMPAVEPGWVIDVCGRVCCRGRRRAFTRRPTA